MSALLVASFMLAQAQDKKPVPPYVGEWVTIQAEGVQGKENLKIVKDGTFTMTLTIPNQKDSIAKGHYTVKADEMPPGTEDKRDCTIYLSLENLNGTDIPKEKVQPKKLGYYSRGPILTDTLSVVFCHPGDQTKITKMFADAAKPKSGG